MALHDRSDDVTPTRTSLAAMSLVLAHLAALPNLDALPKLTNFELMTADLVTPAHRPAKPMHVRAYAHADDWTIRGEIAAMARWADVLDGQLYARIHERDERYYAGCVGLLLSAQVGRVPFEVTALARPQLAGLLRIEGQEPAAGYVALDRRVVSLAMIEPAPAVTTDA